MRLLCSKQAKSRKKILKRNKVSIARKSYTPNQSAHEYHGTPNK